MTYLALNDLATVMPRWRCHKVVQATKILDVLVNPLRLRLDVQLRPGTADSDVNVHDARSQQAWFQPRPEIASRYVPVAGDYLVLYDDGYLSLSPAKAFEEGYALIADMTVTGGPRGEGTADGNVLARSRCLHRDPATNRQCNQDYGHFARHSFWGDGAAFGEYPSKSEPGAAAGPLAPPAAAAALCGAESDRRVDGRTVYCDRPRGHEGAHRYHGKRINRGDFTGQPMVLGAAATCGAPGPYNDIPCDKPKGHADSHGSGAGYERCSWTNHDRKAAAAYLSGPDSVCDAANGDSVCLLPAGHAGKHGWEQEGRNR